MLLINLLFLCVVDNWYTSICLQSFNLSFLTSELTYKCNNQHFKQDLSFSFNIYCLLLYNCTQRFRSQVIDAIERGSKYYQMKG